MEDYESMNDHLKFCNAPLKELVIGIADSCKEISHYVANTVVQKAGSVNTFGDEQLKVDVVSDQIFFEHLKKGGHVSIASSEEVAKEVDLGGNGFSVAFDPLDGSSVIDANFSVGTIFGVWPGRGLVGRSGKEIAAAGFAVYGPRTTILLAVEGHVHEYMLRNDKWIVSDRDKVIKEGKIFAPANLRCAADLEGYSRLVAHWMSNRYTLRYSGGMVPDINHIFEKGKG